MKLLYRLIITSSTILGLFAASLPANAQIPPPKDSSDMLSGSYTGTSYSPYAGRSFPTLPLWGDTHLHTGNSFDAGVIRIRTPVIRLTRGRLAPGLLPRTRIVSHGETRSLHPPVLR